MRRNNTLLAGVVFKGVELYFKDYINSINEQTDKAFDVLIINDGLDGEAFSRFDNFNSISLEETFTSAQIRQIVFDYAYNHNYTNLVFSDCDDYFSDNRVEYSKKYLQRYDFVFNELYLVDDSNTILHKDFMSSLLKGNELNEIAILIDKNVVGLGNSAVNLSRIGRLTIPDDIKAVDWYLFSCLLLQNKTGRFVNQCKTYYRQHGGNLVGMKGTLNIDQLKHGIAVKEVHYGNMQKYCVENGHSEALQTYENRLGALKALTEELVDDQFTKSYIATINQNYDTVFSGWWSDILTLKQFQSYAN